MCKLFSGIRAARQVLHRQQCNCCLSFGYSFASEDHGRSESVGGGQPVKLWGGLPGAGVDGFSLPPGKAHTEDHGEH